jgi:hypothetical protein
MVRGRRICPIQPPAKFQLAEHQSVADQLRSLGGPRTGLPVGVDRKPKSARLNGLLTRSQTFR